MREKGWNGIKNGELNQHILADKFDVLLTFDKNLQHQQNFLKFPVAVFVLTVLNNTYNELHPLTLKINIILETGILKPGVTVVSLNDRGT